MLRSLFHLANFPIAIRQRIASKNRTQLDELGFCSLVLETGGDKVAASSVRDQLNEWISVKRFSPHPDDDLGYLYGISDDDLGDLVEIAFEKAGVKIDVWISAGNQVEDLKTPLDVAQAVSAAKISCKNSNADSRRI